MQHIQASPRQKLYTFAVSEPVLAELEHIAQISMERSLHHSFKSLELLDVLV